MTTVTRSNTSMIAHYSSLDKATQEEKDFAKDNDYCLQIHRTNTVGNMAEGASRAEFYRVFVVVDLPINRAPEVPHL
ncbi:hypothetical protein K3495_g13720 [Podosphaera aphanis]|nr:hypothetical protein K3495_g13720 [Podosphaera aphanis]